MENPMCSSSRWFFVCRLAWVVLVLAGCNSADPVAVDAAPDAAAPDAGSDAAAPDAGSDAAAPDAAPDATARDAAPDAAPDAARDAGSDATAPDAAAPDAAAMACINPADMAVLAMGRVFDALQPCATEAMGALPSTSVCVASRTGLSMPCASCVGAMIRCLLTTCASECAAGITGPSCNACREARCAASFVACSGLSGG
jgi:hypothetical protein